MTAVSGSPAFVSPGRRFDPTQLPGFPPGYGQFFGPGTGGFITHDEIPADPNCVALALRNPAAIYAAASPANTPRCAPAGGHVGPGGIGPLTLGETEDRVRVALGPPQAIKRGFLRYCVAGNGMLLDGEAGDRSGSFGAGGRAPSVLILTTSPTFVVSGRHRLAVAVNTPLRTIRHAFPHARTVAHLRMTSVLALRHGVIAGVARGRAAYLATYAPGAIRSVAALAGYLRRAA